MITKAVDNNNFIHLLPPASSFASRQPGQEINNLLIIPQKVNYNPAKTKNQEKKFKNIEKNGK
jgi:hypothetical protein